MYLTVPPTPVHQPSPRFYFEHDHACIRGQDHAQNAFHDQCAFKGDSWHVW